MKENTYESIEIPVWTNQVYTRLGESETYEVETRELFRELMGKQKGDMVWIVEETMEMRKVYRMSILSVDKNPQDGVDWTSKEFILAPEENIEYIVSSSDQQVGYAIVDNKEEKKKYEYDLSDNGYIHLISQYDYDIKQE